MAQPELLTELRAESTPLSNRLSPQAGDYYRDRHQHPVAWQPWHDDTFALAEKLGKPVLLSIGYSTCHWCRQMSQQSFEDAGVAALMNEYFVNVCVDLHQRPDIDHVYQMMHWFLNGSAGGWPLTLFLCPKTRLPFVAGTYFSSETKAGQLTFTQLLEKVHGFYQLQPVELQRLLQQVSASIAHLQQPAEQCQLPLQSMCTAALELLARKQNNSQAGFGGSPGFTQPVNLGYLLNLQAQARLPQSQLEHLQQTLTVFAQRGINDCIDGGFFRYSTDDDWHIPSFEKTLYDNGLLLEVYARAWQQLQLPLYETAALSIVSWLKQHMLSQTGAFYSAVDAGAEGREGAGYLFEKSEIEAALTQPQLRLFSVLFALQQTANCDGLWHLSQVQDIEAAAAELSLSPEDATGLYLAGRAGLQQLRRAKAPPRLERRLLVGWNALVIKGLAVCGRSDKELLQMAQRALDFIGSELWINQRLFACWQDNEVGRHAFLDDYVYLLDALLELLQTDWRDSDYRLLLALTESMLSLHQDTGQGGFYYTAHDAEELIFRPKPFMDSARPAANGVAARALLRLGHLSGEPRYIDAAEGIFKAAAEFIRQAPDTHLTLVQALHESLQPQPRVLILDDGSRAAWQQRIQSQYHDRVLCFLFPAAAQSYPPDALGMEPGEALVFVGEECLGSNFELETLLQQIDAALGPSVALT